MKGVAPKADVVVDGVDVSLPWGAVTLAGFAVSARILSTGLIPSHSHYLIDHARAHGLGNWEI
jgi:hypothetical protein